MGKIPIDHGNPTFMCPDCLVVISAFWVRALST